MKVSVKIYLLCVIFFCCAINIALYISDDKKFHLFSIAYISISSLHLKFPKHFFHLWAAALSHLRMLQRIGLIKTRSNFWLISHFVCLILKNEVLILQKENLKMIWKLFKQFIINWNSGVEFFARIVNSNQLHLLSVEIPNGLEIVSIIELWATQTLSNWSRTKIENGSKSNVINCLFSIFVEVTLR